MYGESNIKIVGRDKIDTPNTQINDFSFSSLRTRTTKVAELNKFYSPKRLPLLLAHSIFSNVCLYYYSCKESP
jgi:hypothetical protein